MCLSIIKTINGKLTTNTHWWKVGSISSKHRNKLRMSILATSIQQRTGNTSQIN
jgi:hypothetical protein